MSQLGRTILEHEKRHAELLQAIADIEDIKEMLAINGRRVAEIEAQLDDAVKSESKTKTKWEKKSMDAPSQTTIASKFSLVRKSSENMKDSKRSKRIRLEQALSDAKFEEVILQRKVNQHQALQQELDDLYDVVFNGSTPAYSPAEYQLQQQVTAARAVFDRVNSAFTTEKEAFGYISKAEKTMRECKARLKEAFEAVAISIYASWLSCQDHEARDLQTAHELACRVPYLVREAQRHSSEVRPLEELSIIKQVPSRVKHSADQYYTLIKTAVSEVTNYHDQLSNECTTFAGRINISKSVAENAQRTLSEYQCELRAVRQNIFEEFAKRAQEDPNFGETHPPIPLDAPPSYEYEPPPLPTSTCTFGPTLTLCTPSPLVIPHKPKRRIQPPHTDVSDVSVISPFSPTFSPTSTDATTCSSWSSPIPMTRSVSLSASCRRVRPLPRPPVL